MTVVRVRGGSAFSVLHLEGHIGTTLDTSETVLVTSETVIVRG